MRVLYIANNPKGAKDLTVEDEVNELQRRIDEVRSQTDVDLRVYSKLNIEDLAITIARVRPAVIHFTGHGEFAGIVLGHAAKGEVVVQGADLVRIFNGMRIRPKLVVFNACSSDELAETVTAAADFAIGTSAPISNPGAIVMAATLYQHLASGATIQAAFDSAKAMLDIVDDRTVTTTLYPRDDARARSTRLHESFRILAALPSFDRAIRKGTEIPSFGSGPIEVEFGIADAPSSATQLVMFTDDRSIEAEGACCLESARSWLKDADCVQGEHWLEERYSYTGNISWFAVMVTADRAIVTARATTCEALERYYFDEAWTGELQPSAEAVVRGVIERLRLNDGTRRARFAHGPKTERRVTAPQD